MPPTCNCTKNELPQHPQETINSSIKLMFTKTKICMETPLNRNSRRIEAKKKKKKTQQQPKKKKKGKKKKNNVNKLSIKNNKPASTLCKPKPKNISEQT